MTAFWCFSAASRKAFEGMYLREFSKAAFGQGRPTAGGEQKSESAIDRVLLDNMRRPYNFLMLILSLRFVPIDDRDLPAWNGDFGSMPEPPP